MISIITPVYNSEQFIASCIKSVVDQAYPEVEHIIIDGCSTDKTVELIQEFANKYTHIRWISEKDKGQSEAMNKGILMAKGEIIGILNVDDFYEPNVLKIAETSFKSLPEPSLLVGNCNVISQDNKTLFVNKPSRMEFINLLLGSDINPFPVNPSAYFYHRSLHEIIGFYKVEEHYVMDLDFILRAVQVATVKYVDETWGNFKLTDSSKTVQLTKADKINQIVDSLLEEYRKQLLPTQQLQYNLQKFLFNVSAFFKRQRFLISATKKQLIRLFHKL